MDAFLGKAGKRLFEQHLQQYAPADPLYETYTNERGKQKRRKRALPPGLSKRDARILKKLMSRAHYLDKGFNLCGLRFGYTFLIGLIPLVGDFADMGMNYLLVVRPAQQLDIPNWLLRRMLVNNAVSAGMGFVPFIGDVFLAAYKANSRNVALIEEFLRIRGEEFLKMGGSVEPEAESSGWFGVAKRKNKKGKAAANEPPVAPPTDVEQIKPGAGMTGPELKGQLEDVPPPKVDSKHARKRSLSPGFGLFGSKKWKSSPVAAEPMPAPGATGRFVEHVGGMPGGPGPAGPSAS